MRHDIRKHLDVISCYCFSGKSEQKWQEIESYSQELREMYKNLSYGDYCSVSEINGLDTLVVSNGTSCDHLYEVLDAFSIYPEMVKK